MYTAMIAPTILAIVVLVLKIITVAKVKPPYVRYLDMLELFHSLLTTTK